MKQALLLFTSLFLIAPTCAEAQSLGSAPYDIGSPSLTEYYVSPSSGSDTNSGTSPSQPRRTVQSVWNEIPQNASLSTGVRINLLPGTYGSDHLPNYWENRRGTASAPVIVRALNGYGDVFFTRDINMAGISYFYLLGVDIKNQLSDGYGDSFHCESCDHILLRSNSFNGAPNGLRSGGSIAHETIKFNQSQYVFIENNNIQGADDNGIDFVAVQYGHIRANRIHQTEGWCMYVKGGSSYFLVESNVVENCGEGGITVGQGTGLEFMVSPWLRFEANYVRVVNNTIANVTGAALGVNGGYDILLAHNTAYRVGSRSHMVEVVYGERSCDGDSAACIARRNLGGWGPSQIGSDHSQPIGNTNVLIANNILYNPPGFNSGSQHFAIYGPRTPIASGIPTPQRTDTGLSITGNIVWNGDTSMPVGVEEGDQGCQAGNPTCTEAQIRATNAINTFQPDLTNPGTGDFRPLANGVLETYTSQAISDFAPIDAALAAVPEGERSNQMVREFSGSSVVTRPPGAFASSTSAIDFPTSGDGGSTPDGGGGAGNSTLR